MGWGRTLLLGDFGNRMDIGDCENQIAELYREAARKNNINDAQDTSLESLARENDQLKLYLASLVRLCIAKEVFTADEFRGFVDIIDDEDGVRDGRAGGGMNLA